MPSVLFHTRKRSWTALLSFLLLTGCATYSTTVGEMERQLAAGNAAAALSFLEKRDVPERDRVLFLLDKAMLLRLSGNFAQSNVAFEDAKKRMEAVAATSVSETAGSFLINDATRSYAGEPFEQALLHAYAAMNYLDLHSLNEARVEALQVDERLQALSDDDDGPLAEDPFARYLAGVIYEAQGESSDALISYRKAFEAYQAHAKLYGAAVPQALKRDLLRLTQTVGITDEHAKLKKEFAGTEWPARKAYAEKGELVFFFHSGLAPLKREHIEMIGPPAAAHLVSVALPYYAPRNNPVARARLVAGDATFDTETVEDVNALAKATLKEAMPAITLRAIARAVAKYKMTQEAKKNNKSPAAGLLVNLTNLLTERADTRSWLTLPGEIQMVRVLLPAGDHKLRLEMVAGNGAPLTSRELDVHLEKGKKTFLSYHWVPSLQMEKRP